MGKVHYFNRARRRRSNKRWAFAAFVIATAAVLATPQQIATSTLEEPTRYAMNSWATATDAAPDMPRMMSLPKGLADVDCRDFDNQAEAQAFMTGAAPGAAHRLDSDNDGIACERLP